jgi:hypothetical protein
MRGGSGKIAGRGVVEVEVDICRGGLRLDGEARFLAVAEQESKQDSSREAHDATEVNAMRTVCVTR